MEEALSSISKSSLGTVCPVITCRLVRCIEGEKATHEWINDKARVGAVNTDVRGEFASQHSVNVPTDVTVHGGGTRLLTAAIADRTSICNCHVKRMGIEVSTHGVRVGCTTDVNTCSSKARAVIGEEVYEGC